MFYVIQKQDAKVIILALFMYKVKLSQLTENQAIFLMNTQSVYSFSILEYH